MPSQSWVALVPSLPVADGAAYGASVTLTNVGPQPDVTIPANFLTIGSRLRVTASGRISTTATPTITFGLYYGGVGGVALATTGAVVTASTITNLTWSLQGWISVRTAGTSGTAMTTGVLRLGTAALTASSFNIPGSAPAVATINTTTANALVLGATWGTNSASNTLTVHDWLVETLA